MTGRDLIIYILSNGLEDKPILENGKLVGFMTVGEAAIKMNVGFTTILTLASQGKLDAVRIGSELFISTNSVQLLLDKE